MALKTEKLYTAKEVAEIINKSIRSVKDYCKSGKLDAITVIDNGGEQYRISESAIKVFAAKNNINLTESTPFLTKEADMVLSPVQLPAPFSYKPVNVSNELPEKAKQIGLARFNLVKAWLDYRNEKKSKLKADKAFINLYSAGVLYEQTRNILGDVSLKTLYRWGEMLKTGGNYKALAPAYKYNVGERQTSLSEIEQAVFMKLLLHPSKFNIGEAVKLTKEALMTQGFISISSYATFKRYSDDFQKNKYHLWVAFREGQKALADKVVFSISRDYSKLKVGDMLVADGHTFNFMIKDPFTGKPKRATIVGYQDMLSGYIPGFEVMVEENTQCVLSAFRNSVITLGKMPVIAYQDNGRSFKNKFFLGVKDLKECNFSGVFESLGVTPIYAKPYNSKAKPIERFWKEVGTFEKMISTYIGNCIDNRPAHYKRNEKVMKALHQELHKDELPTIPEIVEKFNKYLEYYHAQECPHVKGKSIQQVFDEGRGTGVDVSALDELLMAQEMRKVGKNGVKFINNYYYSDKLFGINDNVVIKYSLFDLRTIRVYSKKGAFVCEASVEQLYNPAVGYLGDVQDKESFKKVIKQQTKLISSTMRDVKNSNKNPLIQNGIYKELTCSNQTLQIEDKKVKKQKDYGNISVDLSGITVEKAEKRKEIPLFDWQDEEERKRLQM